MHIVVAHSMPCVACSVECFLIAILASFGGLVVCSSCCGCCYFPYRIAPNNQNPEHHAIQAQAPSVQRIANLYVLIEDPTPNENDKYKLGHIV